MQRAKNTNLATALRRLRIIGRRRARRGAAGARSAMRAAQGQAAAGFAFLCQPELLQWTKQLTAAPATVYDRALDAEYLRTRIGGAEHRLFDGGHDLLGSWEAAREALPDDGVSREVAGWLAALWRDGATPMGLPFASVSKESFDAWAEWASSAIPGVDRQWLYDLATSDAFELLGVGLGAVGLAFGLSRGDQEKIAELLGSLGIVSIIGANPLMGLAVIATAAYAYLLKRHDVDAAALARGGALAGTSLAIFATLGLPVLIELVIAIAAGALLKTYVLDAGRLETLIERSAVAGGEARRWVVEQVEACRERLAPRPG